LAKNPKYDTIKAMTESKKRILVVDDEKPLAKALEMKLTMAGFEVVTAFDGEEGLKKYEEGKYDMILIDLMMPKKDGFSVLEDLKNKGNMVPVYVLSNLSQENDMKRVKDLGATGYFVKSDTPIIDIVQEVSKILQQ
jgi:two-component system alkaline phosphatase synthesis response regulator PhoP